MFSSILIGIPEGVISIIAMFIRMEAMLLRSVFLAVITPFAYEVFLNAKGKRAAFPIPLSYYIHLLTFYFPSWRQGPYLKAERTHLQQSLGDENILVVRFMEEAPRCPQEIVKNGILIGLRRYHFFGNYLIYMPSNLSCFLKNENFPLLDVFPMKFVSLMLILCFLKLKIL